MVTRCHSLSLAAPLVVIRCHSLYQSLSLLVPLVVTRCTTRCHSLSLDVPLVCLFISDLFSVSNKKLLLKENFRINSHKTQSKNIWDNKFCGERLKKFQKQGDYSHPRGHGEKWTKMGRSPRRMERDGRSAEYFDAMVSALFTAIKKLCVIFFCGFINSF